MKQYDFEFTLVTGEKVVVRIDTDFTLEDGYDAIDALENIKHCGNYALFNGMINAQHVVSVTYEEAL